MPLRNSTAQENTVSGQTIRSTCGNSSQRPSGESAIVRSGDLADVVAAVQLNIDVALDQGHLQARIGFDVGGAKLSVNERRGHEPRGRRQRPPCPATPVARQRPGQASGDEHHQERHPVTAGYVADLNQLRPAILRMLEAPHRHAAQQICLGQLHARINGRGHEDDRQPQAVNADTRQANEHRQITSEINAERQPAEAVAPVRQPQPMQGGHPEEHAGQPQRSIGARRPKSRGGQKNRRQAKPKDRVGDPVQAVLHGMEPGIDSQSGKEIEDGHDEQHPWPKSPGLGGRSRGTRRGTQYAGSGSRQLLNANEHHPPHRRNPCQRPDPQRRQCRPEQHGPDQGLAEGRSIPV